MSSLRSRIQELSEQFTVGILVALRGASLEEISDASGTAFAPTPRAARAAAPAAEDALAPTKAKRGKGGRLARRSAEDIQKVAELIVACVGKHPEGIRAENLREELKIDKKEFTMPLTTALESGALRKEGEKRATVYFLAGRKGSGSSASTKTAKPAKRAKRKAASKKSAKKASSAKPKAKAASKKSAPKKKAAPKHKASSKNKASSNGVASHASTPEKSESAEATGD
jgi:hypothetical protein